MKTFLFYLDFFAYMIKTIGEKNKVENFKNQGKIKEAERCTEACVKNWCLHIINKIGIKMDVKGRENIPKTTCVFVVNHQGFLDIPVLITALDTSVGFIAKKEMLKIKILSYWMKQIHCIFMDRSNIRESMKAINKGAENLKNGYSMVIFPEGTRSKGPKMGEFKKGSMKLALKAGVPIVPVSIDGTYKLREGNKGAAIKSGEVSVTIGKPIYTDKLSREEQSTLSENIKTIIQSKIN